VVSSSPPTCSPLPIADLLFRLLYAFFVIEIALRWMAHVGVTRHPTNCVG